MITLAEQERNELEQHVQDGWIRKQICPYAKLWIYTYSTTTELEEHWDKYTRMARGLVVDENNRIVINCIPKFFNAGTKFAERIAINDDGVRITEKNDGYLIQIRKDHEHGLIITSKGSFTSDMCQMAKKIISGYEDKLTEDLNYICELCCNFPGDEAILVKRWNGVEKLVLFSIRDDDGNEVMDERVFPECFEAVKEFTPTEAEEYLKRDDIEGVVLRLGDKRVKCKTEHFLMMHRLISDIRKIRVWELLSSGHDLDEISVPDEFMAVMKEWKAEMLDQIAKWNVSLLQYESQYASLTDKDLALKEDIPYFYKAMMFNRRHNKGYMGIMWNKIREQIKEENNESRQL